MLGQDIPTLERLPNRYMSHSEQRLWDQALELLDDLSDYIVMLKMLSMNAAQCYYWSQKHGFNMAKPAALEARVLELESNVKRVRELVRKVEDHELGVRFVDGDFDIVDPNQQKLDGLILIAIGVVVLAGVVGALIYYKEEADELRPKYNNLLAATDKVFCKEGSPVTCAEWKAYKKDSGYEERLSITEKIAEEIEGPAKTGMQWGVAILIPLVALFVMSKVGNK